MSGGLTVSPANPLLQSLAPPFTPRAWPASKPNSGKIGVIEAGGGERTPLVFLHGVGSDKSVWAPQLEHFGRSRRTVAFDYPGYGESQFRVTTRRATILLPQSSPP